MIVVQLGLGKYTIIHCTLKVFRLPDQLVLCALDPHYGIPALILKTRRLELLEKEISARSGGMFLSPQLWKSSSLLGGKLPVWGGSSTKETHKVPGLQAASPCSRKVTLNL